MQVDAALRVLYYITYLGNWQPVNVQNSRYILVKVGSVSGVLDFNSCWPEKTSLGNSPLENFPRYDSIKTNSCLKKRCLVLV